MAKTVSLYTLKNNLYTLERHAKAYLAMYGKSASTYNVNALMYNFLRSAKYTGSQWFLTAGPIDERFKIYVRDHDSEIYSLGTQQVEFTDSDGKTIDFTHLNATLDGYYSNIMPQSWSGWGGDLATLVVNVKNNTNDSQDFNTLVNSGKRLIGNPSYNMDEADIVSDLDAHNMYNMIHSNNMSFASAFENYYISTSKFRTRFNQFVDSFGGEDRFNSYMLNYFNNQGSDLHIALAKFYNFGKMPSKVQKLAVSGVFAEYVLSRYV